MIRFWIWPVVITVAVIAAVFAGGWWVHEPLSNWIWPPPESSGVGGSLVRILHDLFSIVLMLVLWTIGLVASIAVSAVLAAPFNDMLSEAVERLNQGHAAPPFSIRELLDGAVRSVRVEAAKFALLMVILGPLFVLSFFVPVIGTLVYPLLSFLFGALYFGLDYVDWPASRRGLGVRWRYRFVRRNLFAVLGLGVGVWLCLFVPLLNLFLMPAAVAGGTMMFLDIERLEMDKSLEARDPRAVEHSPDTALPQR